MSETTLKMILMSQSWGWDAVAPSLVPGQLASRSKQVGTLPRWHLPAGGEVIVEEGDGHRQDDQVGDQ